MTDAVRLPDERVLADLATFVGRAKRADPDGAARLVGHGDVLAVYVSPVHGAGGPTVLGLRTITLAAPSALDVTVTLAALTDRLARGVAGGGGPVEVAVPPVPATNVSWAGVSPPRSGWELVGLVQPAALLDAAAAGIAEIATGAPEGSGAQAVARLRGQVWGRPLPGFEPAEAAPCGVAFVAQALGFLGPEAGRSVAGTPTERPDDDAPVLFRSGPWVRLTTVRGHVLARRALPFP